MVKTPCGEDQGLLYLSPYGCLVLNAPGALRPVPGFLSLKCSVMMIDDDDSDDDHGDDDGLR